MDEREQRRDGLGGAPFLPEAQQGAGENNGQNDERVRTVREKERDDGGKHENKDDRTAELGKQQDQRPDVPVRFEAESVIAVVTRPGFFRAESLRL